MNDGFDLVSLHPADRARKMFLLSPKPLPQNNQNLWRSIIPMCSLHNNVIQHLRRKMSEKEFTMTIVHSASRSEETLLLQEGSLESERYLPQVLPAVFGSGDLTALLVLNVFWVSNITPISAAGPVAFLYWIICAAGFFVPCSLVMIQLAAILPHEGGLYNWTWHCLGKTWAFFVTLCTWLPGVLSILNASVIVNSCLQAANAHWLTDPWQQGCAILLVLFFVGLFSLQRTRTVQVVINVATLGIGAATILVTIAALLWLFTGHRSATTEWIMPPLSQWNPGLFGNTTLALLGSNISLALMGETRHRSAIRSHMIWGTGLTVIGYLLWTFALLTVQGAQAAATQANPILLLVATVASVFGSFVGKLLLMSLAFYYFVIAVTLNLCYSRLLVVLAIDRRISMRFARLNVHRVPVFALLFQIGVVVLFALLLYFLVPLFAVGASQAANLNSIAYNVIGASLALVWALSYMFPFVNVIILWLRQRKQMVTGWFLPAPMMLICVGLGIVTLGSSILTTLFNSFLPALIPNSSWWYIIGLVLLACLVLCWLGAVYGSSEARYEQMQ
jgi:amino acid transporter